MTTMTTRPVEEYELIHSILKKNPVVGDDHNGGNKTIKVDGIGICKGRTVCLLKCGYYSVNPLYVTGDGHVRLSSGAVSGPIGSETIEEFNESLPRYLEDSRITNVHWLS